MAEAHASPTRRPLGAALCENTPPPAGLAAKAGVDEHHLTTLEGELRVSKDAILGLLSAARRGGGSGDAVPATPGAAPTPAAAPSAALPAAALLELAPPPSAGYAPDAAGTASEPASSPRPDGGAAAAAVAARLTAAVATADAAARAGRAPSTAALTARLRRRDDLIATLKARLTAAESAAAALAADRDRLRAAAATSSRLREQRAALVAGARGLRAAADARRSAAAAARAEADALAGKLRFAAVRETTAREAVRALEAKLARRDAVLERLHGALVELGARHVALRAEADAARADAAAAAAWRRGGGGGVPQPEASDATAADSAGLASRLEALERSADALAGRAAAEAAARAAAAAEVEALRAALAAARNSGDESHAPPAPASTELQAALESARADAAAARARADWLEGEVAAFRAAVAARVGAGVLSPLARVLAGDDGAVPARGPTSPVALSGADAAVDELTERVEALSRLLRDEDE